MKEDRTSVVVIPHRAKRPQVAEAMRAAKSGTLPTFKVEEFSLNQFEALTPVILQGVDHALVMILKRRNQVRALQT